jgi:hypothetical protein
MNRRRQQETMRRCAGVLLLTTLGGLPACNAVSGASAIEFVDCTVRFDAPKPTALVGGTGGVVFDDACPEGQALIGFQAGVISGGYALSGLVAVCGVVALSSSDPRTITTTPGQSSPTRGTVGTDIKTAMCPAGQVVVGFDSRTFTDMMSQGTFTSTIFLHCAPLAIEALSESPAASPGATETLDAIGSGSIAVGDAVPTTDCPTGQVAVASQGRSTTVVDAFGLGCAKVVISCGASEQE